MSLKVRIIVLLILVFLFGAADVLYRTVNQARQEVERDVSAATELTLALLALADSSNVSRDSTSFPLQALYNDEIVTRHIRLIPEEETVLVEQRFQQEINNINVPDWFLAWLNVDRPNLIQVITLPDNNRVMIYNTPVDGIADAWSDTVGALYGRGLALILFLFILLYFLRQWMKGVPVIVEVLSEMRKGDYYRNVPSLPLPEFNAIGESINHLGSVLGTSKAENERLSRKAQEIQDEERFYLAQELHDVQGQSMSAIKAMAVSLQQNPENLSPEAVTKTAAKIEDVARQSYDSVRDMMHSLRSFELDELGIVAALQQVADDWNDTHAETFCKLSIHGDFSDMKRIQAQSVYRIVQEALTNVSKHANAETVSVSLSGNEIVSLIISDDGKGMDSKAIKEGMGMKGLRERVILLNGKLFLDAGNDKGLTIHVEFPRMTDKDDSDDT